MFIIGERLNSTRQPVLKAMRDRDEDYILKDALRQEKAGSSYIDLNAAALLGREIETLKWVIPLLQSELSVPLAIDTTSAEAMAVGLNLHAGRALLNSLSGESERVRKFLPLIKEHKPQILVLCLDDDGLPETPKKELAVARKMVDLLTSEGVDPQDIFIDPLVRPIGVDQGAAALFLESLGKIKGVLPEVKTVAGISNVSYGMPLSLLNRTLLVLALGCGLDAAILDPLDAEIMAALRSARALLGSDPSLKSYLAFGRETDRRDPKAE
jgi:cobalamin-dependent methionine synthase I